MPQRYDAVLFDLLTALLASDRLWGDVAGDPELGRNWRQASLKLVTGSNKYQPYEPLVVQSALQLGLTERHAENILARWDELEPWPGVAEALGKLAERAARRTGVEYAAIVSAERAGWYKPAPQPYLLGIGEIGIAADRILFVAGSAHDIGGAHRTGLQVYWHNYYGQPLPAGGPPLANERTLARLPEIVFGADPRL